MGVAGTMAAVATVAVSSGRRSSAALSASKHWASMAVPTVSAMISSAFGIGIGPR